MDRSGETSYSTLLSFDIISNQPRLCKLSMETSSLSGISSKSRMLSAPWDTDGCLSSRELFRNVLSQQLQDIGPTDQGQFMKKDDYHNICTATHHAVNGTSLCPN